MTLAVVPLVAITGLAVFGVAATVGPALNLLETSRYEHAVTDRGEATSLVVDRTSDVLTLLGAEREAVPETVPVTNARLPMMVVSSISVATSGNIAKSSASVAATAARPLIVPTIWLSTVQSSA